MTRSIRFIEGVPKRYEPVFMRLAVVKESLRLASYQHVPPHLSPIFFRSCRTVTAERLENPRANHSLVLRKPFTTNAKPKTIARSATAKIPVRSEPTPTLMKSTTIPRAARSIRFDVPPAHIRAAPTKREPVQ